MWRPRAATAIIGHERARGEADAQNEECTAPSVERSIGDLRRAIAVSRSSGEDQALTHDRRRSIERDVPRQVRPRAATTSSGRPVPELGIEPRPGPDDDRRPRLAHRPRRRPSERPQVVGDGRPPFGRSRGSVSAARSARQRPRRSRRGPGAAQLDPVVGRDDLARAAAGAPSQTSYEVDQAPAREAPRPRGPRGPRQAGQQLGQDDVRQLAPRPPSPAGSGAPNATRARARPVGRTNGRSRTRRAPPPTRRSARGRPRLGRLGVAGEDQAPALARDAAARRSRRRRLRPASRRIAGVHVC